MAEIRLYPARMTDTPALTPLATLQVCPKTKFSDGMQDARYKYLLPI